MKTMKTIARLCTLAAAALLLLPTGIAAQNAAVRKIMQTAREDNRAMHHLDILCNRFGGRIGFLLRRGGCESSGITGVLKQQRTEQEL